MTDDHRYNVQPTLSREGPEETTSVSNRDEAIDKVLRDAMIMRGKHAPVEPLRQMLKRFGGPNG
ncbi:MAG: hypothetical protein AAF742_00140 [Pseudomonadota bacterium]